MIDLRALHERTCASLQDEALVTYLLQSIPMLKAHTKDPTDTHITQTYLRTFYPAQHARLLRTFATTQESTVCVACHSTNVKVLRECTRTCLDCGRVQESYVMDTRRPMHHYVPYGTRLNGPRHIHRYRRIARMQSYMREVTGQLRVRTTHPLFTLLYGCSSIREAYQRASDQPRAHALFPLVPSVMQALIPTLTLPTPTTIQRSVILQSFHALSEAYNALPTVRRNFISYAYVYHYITSFHEWHDLHRYVRLPTTPRILREYKSIMRVLRPTLEKLTYNTEPPGPCASHGVARCPACRPRGSSRTRTW